MHGGQSFSLQSVMKLIVSFAVLDAIDHQQLSLDDQVIVHRQDLSLYVQPIADLVGPNGYRTTVRDLIHRAIVDSDSAASDILARKIGGTRQVQSFLDRAGIQGIRIDRDERQLQTEIVGLTWRPQYVDPQVLRKAIESVPVRDKEAAYRRYRDSTFGTLQHHSEWHRFCSASATVIYCLPLELTLLLKRWLKQ